MQTLDAQLDTLNATFADASVALEYDARVLYNKFETADSQQQKQSERGQNSNKKASVPCLGPRAHWMDCVTKYRVDTRPCDSYLTTLERCVQETVVRLATADHSGSDSGQHQP
jgi:hypothetical protein